MIRSNSSLSRSKKNAAVTFTPRAQSHQSESFEPPFFLWFNDATGRAAGQTSMTCQSGVLQTHRSTACHQMHLSERGDERAGRLALKFKVTLCDCDSSSPRRGNRRKRWGERKKQRKPTDLFLHTHIHSYTFQTHPLPQRPIHKHLRQHDEQSKAVLAAPRG